jgi:molybdate transport system substrate-binding protein
MFVSGLLLGLVGCTPSKPGVVLFAAASTVDAVEDLAAAFELETGVSVSVSTAGSSVLARQIESGANAAVFLSANADWVEHLADQGLVAERVEFLENNLVAIVPKGSEFSPSGPDGLLNDAVATIAVADRMAYRPAAMRSKR